MQRWLDSYSNDHQNPTNRLLHWICVPLIVWCAIAMMWTIPVPPMIGRPGFWAVCALVLAFAWYWKQSHRIAAALFIALLLLCLLTGVGVFVVAWVGQFIGHAIEGRRPSFLTDLAYLLVGPAWLMDKLLRRVGI